jgi:hypothetical protein
LQLSVLRSTGLDLQVEQPLIADEEHLHWDRQHRRWISHEEAMRARDGSGAAWQAGRRFTRGGVPPAR